MSKPVPYLSEEAIESDAAALLAEYAQARGAALKPPIPIEDIVEKHLKLGVEFDDTHRLFGVPRSGLGLEPDILGAMFFDDARIVIDESLDPEENPAKEGRYRFTLAHERFNPSMICPASFLLCPSRYASVRRSGRSSRSSSTLSVACAGLNCPDRTRSAR